MKQNIRKTLVVSALALGGSLITVQTQAALIMISGSSSIGSSGVEIEGPDLSAPGLITVVNPKSGISTGDYSSIATDTDFVLSGIFDLAELSTWNIFGPLTFGSYIASELAIIDQSADFLNVFTRGIFSPGSSIGTNTGGCATDGNSCLPTDTSIRWTFSQSGASVSAGGSLASPAIPFTPVAVPGSLALLALGLGGLLGMANLRSREATSLASGRFARE